MAAGVKDQIDLAVRRQEPLSLPVGCALGIMGSVHNTDRKNSTVNAAVPYFPRVAALESNLA